MCLGSGRLTSSLNDEHMDGVWACAPLLELGMDRIRLVMQTGLYQVVVILNFHHMQYNALDELAQHYVP